MNKMRVIALILLAVMLAGCAKNSAAPAPQSVEVEKVIQAPAMESPAGAAYDSASRNYAGEGAPAAVPNAAPAYTESSENQMIVMNASLTIVVADPGKSMADIDAMAKEMGGFVVNSNLYKTTLSSGLVVPEASISIRIPAAKLTEATDKIKALVKNAKTDILSENVSGQDVTKEYTDLASRLRNLEATADKLNQIMDSATKTEDALNVLNQLTYITEQIEVIKGQMKYYEEASAKSLITVTLRAEETVQPLEVGGWKPQGVARDAVQALLDALKFLANAAIWGGLFCLPIGLVIGVPAFFIVRAIIRWRRKNKADKLTATPPVEHE